MTGEKAPIQSGVARSVRMKYETASRDGMKSTFRSESQCWRKSRIAARLLLKKRRQSWNARDRRLAILLVEDPGVTNRLIDQAVSFLTARKNGYRLLDKHD